MLKEAHRLSENCNFTGAEQVLQRVLETVPTNTHAFDLLGFVLYFQNRYIDAERACRESLRLAPENAYAMKGLGLSLVAQGNVYEGLVSLQKAIAQEPSWFDPRWDALVVCGEHKLKDDAAKFMGEMWGLFPRRRDLLRKLAEYYELEIPTGVDEEAEVFPTFQCAAQGLLMGDRGP
jgi:tetratricopeptide (TPR) repeat protein